MASSVRMTLTLEWIGRWEGNAGPRAGDPPPDSFVQLFYRLNLLYAEAFDLDRRGGHPPAGFHSWYRSYRDWTQVFERHPFATPSRPGPPLREWPTHVPVPPVPSGAELRFESIAMASPLDLIFHLPAAVVVPGGAAAVLGFIHLLERAWNAPKRIRLEGSNWTGRSNKSRSRLMRYANLERDGFALREGSVEFPDEWEWPKERH
jgi:hypothetical protein